MISPSRGGYLPKGKSPLKNVGYEERESTKKDKKSFIECALNWIQLILKCTISRCEEMMYVDVGLLENEWLNRNWIGNLLVSTKNLNWDAMIRQLCLGFWFPPSPCFAFHTRTNYDVPKIIIILLTIYNSGSTKQYFAIYMKWNTLNSKWIFYCHYLQLFATST